MNRSSSNFDSRSLVVVLGWSLLFILLSPRVAAAQEAKFNGEITDEHLNCEQTPLKATEGVTDKVECVLYWAHFVRPNSKYVLYDSATKMAYQLDDQSLAQQFAGEKAQVVGTLNVATKTIKVREINGA